MISAQVCSSRPQAWRASRRSWVVDEDGSGVELGREVVERGGEAWAGRVVVQPLVEVFGKGVLAAVGVDAEVVGGVAEGSAG
jgi:hypothetical protein